MRRDAWRCGAERCDARRSGAMQCGAKRGVAARCNAPRRGAEGGAVVVAVTAQEPPARRWVEWPAAAVVEPQQERDAVFVTLGDTMVASDEGESWVALEEVLELPLEGVLAAILPLIGITGDVALDGVEAVVGPVIIATILLPYLVPPPLVQQIQAEGERTRSF